MYENDLDLRTAIIRLAHEVPELRKHLVPIIRENIRRAAIKEAAASLNDRWEAYKKIHPESPGIPPFLRAEAEGMTHDWTKTPEENLMTPEARRIWQEKKKWPKAPEAPRPYPKTQDLSKVKVQALPQS